MGQWEYMTVPLIFEKREYTVYFINGRKIYGLQAILEEWDAYGWEYVDMVIAPNNWNTVTPDQFFAIFRRPRTGQQWQQGPILGPFRVLEE